MTSRPFEDLHRPVGIYIDGGVSRTISGYFSGPEQYPDFLEACAEERGIGYRYTASHFKTFEELDAIVPEGMVLLVDYFGEELVTRHVFFQMLHSFALKALETEHEQKLEAACLRTREWAFFFWGAIAFWEWTETFDRRLDHFFPNPRPSYGFLTTGAISFSYGDFEQRPQ